MWVLITSVFYLFQQITEPDGELNTAELSKWDTDIHRYDMWVLANVLNVEGLTCGKFYKAILKFPNITRFPQRQRQCFIENLILSQQGAY